MIEAQQTHQTKSQYIQLEALPQENLLSGTFTYFITVRELELRNLSMFEMKSPEHPDWEPITEYTRNMNYDTKNLRTPDTLSKCLHKLIHVYMEKQLPQHFNNRVVREKLASFIYERVRAIRQQYYVQKIFDPRASLTIFKVLLILETILEQNVQAIGLGQFAESPELLRQLIDQGFQAQTTEAFTYILLLSSRDHFLQILHTFSEFIFGNAELQHIVEIRSKIEKGNYYRYLEQMDKNPNMMIKYILWTRIIQFRTLIGEVVTKARMTVRKQWLCKIMGFPKVEGTINIKQAQIATLNPQRKQLDLPIKHWSPRKQFISYVSQMYE